MASMHELPDGARIAYDDTGSGRPVVLIHGVAMSRRVLPSREVRIVPMPSRCHSWSSSHGPPKATDPQGRAMLRETVRLYAGRRTVGVELTGTGSRWESWT